MERELKIGNQRSRAESYEARDQMKEKLNEQSNQERIVELTHQLERAEMEIEILRFKHEIFSEKQQRQLDKAVEEIKSHSEKNQTIQRDLEKLKQEQSDLQNKYNDICFRIEFQKEINNRLNEQKEQMEKIYQIVFKCQN